MKRKSLFHTAVLAVLLVMLSAGPVLLMGCGREEEQAPTPEPGAPEQPSAEVAPVEEALGPDAPVTLPVLRLMPESAVVAAAVPSITSLYETSTTIAKRYAPPEQVDAAVAEWASKAAQELGVPEAKTPMDIARQRGFDPDAPVGFFADMEQVVAAFEKAVTAAAARQAETPAPVPEAAPDAATPPDAPDAPTSPEPEAVTPAEPSFDDVFNEEFEKALREQPPAWVAAWQVVDAATAEKSVKELGALVLDAEEPLGDGEPLTVGDVAVHSFQAGRFAYAIAGKRMFAASSVPMLQESLARLSKPARIRYGTSALPSLRRDETVVLSRMDRVMEYAKRVMPVLAKLPENSPYARIQLDAMEMETWTKYYTGADPVVMAVTTFPAEENKPPRVVFRGLADTSQHPGLAELLSETKPLRLSPLMPENTQLLVAQQFTPLTKEEFRKQWTMALPPEAQAEAAGVLSTVNQVLDIINDEVTLGVFPSETGLPGILLLAGLTNKDQAKTLLDGFVPTSAGEEYNGVQILNVVYPIPMVTIYLAYVDNNLVVATDVPAMKSLIDRLQGKTPPALFAALDPPVDPAVPRQALVVIKSQLLTDVVIPLSAFAGGLGQAQQPVDTVTKVLRELRVTNEVKQNLYESSLTVYLK